MRYGAENAPLPKELWQHNCIAHLREGFRNAFCSETKLNSVKLAVNWPRWNSRLGEMLRYMTGSANFEVLGYHGIPFISSERKKVHNADRVLIQVSIHSSFLSNVVQPRSYVSLATAGITESNAESRTKATVCGVHFQIRCLFCLGSTSRLHCARALGPSDQSPSIGHTKHTSCSTFSVIQFS